MRQRAKGQKSSKKAAAVDKGLKAKEAAVAKARAEVEALTHSQAQAGVDEAIARAKQELEAARSRVESPDIVTTQVGRFVVEARPMRALNADKADAVAKGTVVGRVVSTSLKVTLKEAIVPPPGRYTVQVGSERIEARADAARLYIDGEPSLVGKACTVRVPEGRRPWVLTLLR